MVLGGRCVRTCVCSLRQTSVESIRSCQNLLHFARTFHNFVRTLPELTATLPKLAATLPKLTTTLPKLAVTYHKSIKLAEFSRIHLSSVSPRHSYCNWASPVTIRVLSLILFSRSITSYCTNFSLDFISCSFNTLVTFYIIQLNLFFIYSLKS